MSRFDPQDNWLAVRHAVATAILALGACASYPPTPPLPRTSPPDPVLTESSKAEREAVSRIYLSCLARAAKRLDDYKSDPATLARGMMSACEAEFDDVVDVRSRHLDDLEGKQKTERVVRGASFDAAVQLVIANRKGALTR
jgi:hypothetical protein